MIVFHQIHIRSTFWIIAFQHYNRYDELDKAEKSNQIFNKHIQQDFPQKNSLFWIEMSRNSDIPMVRINIFGNRDVDGIRQATIRPSSLSFYDSISDSVIKIAIFKVFPIVVALGFFTFMLVDYVTTDRRHGKQSLYSESSECILHESFHWQWNLNEQYRPVEFE